MAEKELPIAYLFLKKEILPMDSKWHYNTPGGQEGPVDDDQIRNLIQKGDLRPTDHVWRKGMEAWVAVNDVPELRPMVRSARPPMSTAAPSNTPRPGTMKTMGREIGGVLAGLGECIVGAVAVVSGWSIFIKNNNLWAAAVGVIGILVILEGMYRMQKARHVAWTREALEIHALEAKPTSTAMGDVELAVKRLERVTERLESTAERLQQAQNG